MNTLYFPIAIKQKSENVCHKDPNGFTLIELLVVIAIIGILAAMIFIGTQSSTANARDGRRQSELSQTKKALQAYYLQNGRYPTTSASGISLEDDNDTNGTFSQTMKSGGYMSIIPRDPNYAVSAGDYAYKYIATTTNAFILCAKTEVRAGYACTDQTSGGGIAFSPEPPVDFGGWGGGGGGGNPELVTNGGFDGDYSPWFDGDAGRFANNYAYFIWNGADAAVAVNQPLELSPGETYHIEFDISVLPLVYGKIGIQFFENEYLLYPENYAGLGVQRVSLDLVFDEEETGSGALDFYSYYILTYDGSATPEQRPVIIDNVSVKLKNP